MRGVPLEQVAFETGFSHQGQLNLKVLGGEGSRCGGNGSSADATRESTA